MNFRIKKIWNSQKYSWDEIIEITDDLILHIAGSEPISLKEYLDLMKQKYGARANSFDILAIIEENGKPMNFTNIDGNISKEVLYVGCGKYSKYKALTNYNELIELVSDEIVNQIKSYLYIIDK